FTPMEPLLYCSSRCAFAGTFYELTCTAILLTGGSIYILSYMSGMILVDPKAGFALLLCWGGAFVFWFLAFLGYRERATRKNVQQSLRIDE
ncbi:MAG: hypothetical protein ACFFES_17710, partial [Candidatus Thorarchaeota archaeon]